MRRAGQFGDASVNPMMAAQMQHMSSQRMQYNTGMDEHQYMPSKAEGQWQWDSRGDPKGTHSMSPDIYKEGQRSDASRSTFHGQRPDSKMALEKQLGSDSRSQPRQDDVEAGFDDINHPPTFEVIEEKFLLDIMKLTKEQHEAEDKENARHRERLIDIDTQYQEKLAAIRTRQAALRDEFLRKESLARHQQYQQLSMMSSYHKNSGLRETYGYGPAPPAATAAQGAPHQGFGRGNFESYRERPEFVDEARIREFESRGQYPVDRAYNSGGGRYY